METKTIEQHLRRLFSACTISGGRNGQWYARTKQGHLYRIAEIGPGIIQVDASQPELDDLREDLPDRAIIGDRCGLTVDLREL
jgi:hypothetical protein